MKDSGVIKAVIFDLDDTLVSEYEYVQSGYRYVSKRLEDRLGRTADEIFERLTELSKETYSRAFNRLFDSYGIEYTDEDFKGGTKEDFDRISKDIFGRITSMLDGVNDKGVLEK